MIKHIGRKVATLGLAVLVVGGAAGTALAAGSGSSAAQPGAASPVAVAASVTQTTLTKMTMTQLTAKLGVSEKQMVIALDDMKGSVAGSKGLTAAGAKDVMVKVLSGDLGISAASAEWVVDEISGGYVWTNVDWGFGK